MANKIIFNGQEYPSVEEMPAEVRQAYEQVMGVFADTDRDGTPDILEGIGGATIQAVHTTIVANGQAYSSVDEMPADVRKQYKQAMGKFDADRNGVPDVLEGGGFTALLKEMPGAIENADDASTPKMDRNTSVNPKAVTPSALPDWMHSAFSAPKLLLVAAAFVMLVVAALVVWVTFGLFSALR